MIVNAGHGLRQDSRDSRQTPGTHKGNEMITTLQKEACPDAGGKGVSLGKGGKGTSMIGKCQGETETPLHLMGRIPQARTGF